MSTTTPFSLISKHDTWGNTMVLVGNAALALWMTRHTTLGKLMGPPITAMGLTFVMATAGVIASGGSAAANQLQHVCLCLATPLVLMGADFRNARQRCGPLVWSFLLAAVATLAASAVGWWLVGPALTTALSSNSALYAEDGLKIAAGIMARNIGGGLNYMAVCSSLGASPTAIAAGLCADNIFGLMYFPTTSAISANRPDPAEEEDQVIVPQTLLEQQQKAEAASSSVSSTTTTSLQMATNVTASTTETATAVATSTTSTVADHDDDDKKDDNKPNIERVTNVLATATTLVWLGRILGGARGALPLCTLLTVLLVNNQWVPTSWVKSMQPTSQVLGTVALYLFFSTLGSQGVAVADSVRASMLPLGIFLGILYSVHGTWLWLLHKLFPKHPSMNPQRLLIASSAAIGGPATAMALAQAQKWPSLEVPGLLVGNLGDAVGTFLGIAFFAIFSTGG